MKRNICQAPRTVVVMTTPPLLLQEVAELSEVYFLVIVLVDVLHKNLHLLVCHLYLAVNVVEEGFEFFNEDETLAGRVETTEDFLVAGLLVLVFQRGAAGDKLLESNIVLLFNGGLVCVHS